MEQRDRVSQDARTFLGADNAEEDALLAIDVRFHFVAEVVGILDETADRQAGSGAAGDLDRPRAAHRPTTQGKNERFHQTLFRYLDKQPLAASLEQLQSQVDAFDVIYNTDRPHQGLPGRITPQQAWNATPKLDPPRPTPRPAIPAPDGVRVTRIRDNGTVFLRRTRFYVSRTLAGQVAYLVETDQTLMVFDDRGTLLIEHPWPTPGVKYVGSGRPRGPQRTL